MESSMEKRAASDRSMPSSRAADMVMPERLVPGMRARAWAQPMMTASPTPRCSTWRTVMPIRSAT